MALPRQTYEEALRAGDFRLVIHDVAGERFVLVAEALREQVAA